MITEGVDYSTTRPDPRALYAAGKRFAARYVGMGSTSKRLTRAEARELNTAGLSIVALCEEGETSALLGYDRGQLHAQRALAEASECGMPAGRPIYFAVDFDATLTQLSTVAHYFEGVSSVLPHRQVGAYGGIDTIAYLFARGLIAWGFQTYAWSEQHWHPQAQMQQYHNHATVAGSTVDLDRGMVADFGQWRIGAGPASGEDIDMATVEEVWQADLVPVGGDPNNRTWQAKNALGYTVDLGRKIVAMLEEQGARIAALEARTPGLSEADRDTIVGELTDVINDRLALVPTAAEIGRAAAERLRDHMPE